MSIQETAEQKYEAGEPLTAEELATLSPALQAAYADDEVEEAEHQALMADDD